MNGRAPGVQCADAMVYLKKGQINLRYLNVLIAILHR